MGFGQRRFDAIASCAWRRCAPALAPRSGVAFERDTPKYKVLKKCRSCLTAAAACGDRARIGGGRGSRARAGSIDAPVRGAGLTDT